jgi:hypothetical protein
LLNKQREQSSVADFFFPLIPLAMAFLQDYLMIKGLLALFAQALYLYLSIFYCLHLGCSAQALDDHLLVDLKSMVGPE